MNNGQGLTSSHESGEEDVERGLEGGLLGQQGHEGGEVATNVVHQEEEDPDAGRPDLSGNNLDNDGEEHREPSLSCGEGQRSKVKGQVYGA